jgi:hypothetical protein
VIVPVNGVGDYVLIAEFILELAADYKSCHLVLRIRGYFLTGLVLIKLSCFSCDELPIFLGKRRSVLKYSNSRQSMFLHPLALIYFWSVNAKPKENPVVVHIKE